MSIVETWIGRRAASVLGVVLIIWQRGGLGIGLGATAVVNGINHARRVVGANAPASQRRAGRRGAPRHARGGKVS